MLDERWDELTDDDWVAFAKGWVAGLNGQKAEYLPRLPRLIEDESETVVEECVIEMSITASHEAQWKFIIAAFECADEEAHGHLAAGPVEDLLGNYGAEYIDKFESLATTDTKFAKMLDGCYQNQMTDEIWQRVCTVRYGCA